MSSSTSEHLRAGLSNLKREAERVKKLVHVTKSMSPPAPARRPPSPPKRSASGREVQLLYGGSSGDTETESAPYNESAARTPQANPRASYSTGNTPGPAESPQILNIIREATERSITKQSPAGKPASRDILEGRSKEKMYYEESEVADIIMNLEAEYTAVVEAKLHEQGGQGGSRRELESENESLRAELKQLNEEVQVALQHHMQEKSELTAQLEEALALAAEKESQTAAENGHDIGKAPGGLSVTDEDPAVTLAEAEKRAMLLEDLRGRVLQQQRIEKGMRSEFGMEYTKLREENDRLRREVTGMRLQVAAIPDKMTQTLEEAAQSRIMCGTLEEECSELKKKLQQERDAGAALFAEAEKYKKQAERAHDTEESNASKSKMMYEEMRKMEATHVEELNAIQAHALRVSEEYDEKLTELVHELDETKSTYESKLDQVFEESKATEKQLLERNAEVEELNAQLVAQLESMSSEWGKDPKRNNAVMQRVLEENKHLKLVVDNQAAKIHALAKQAPVDITMQTGKGQGNAAAKLKAGGSALAETLMPLQGSNVHRLSSPAYRQQRRASPKSQASSHVEGTKPGKARSPLLTQTSPGNADRLRLLQERQQSPKSPPVRIRDNKQLIDSALSSMSGLSVSSRNPSQAGDVQRAEEAASLTWSRQRPSISDTSGLSRSDVETIEAELLSLEMELDKPSHSRTITGDTQSGRSSVGASEFESTHS